LPEAGTDEWWEELSVPCPEAGTDEWWEELSVPCGVELDCTEAVAARNDNEGGAVPPSVVDPSGYMYDCEEDEGVIGIRFSQLFCPAAGSCRLLSRPSESASSKRSSSVYTAAGAATEQDFAAGASDSGIGEINQSLANEMLVAIVGGVKATCCCCCCWCCCGAGSKPVAAADCHDDDADDDDENHNDVDDNDDNDPVKLFQTRGKWWELIVYLYTTIFPKNHPNVGSYTIHEAYTQRGFHETK
jgi:hypothetical protein